jgi:uncharacterized protein (DUF433 family)
MTVIPRRDPTMQLEEYFDFWAPDDIRIKGTRIGIEDVLYEYIHNVRSPEEIKDRFYTVSLEQVYATILYYLSNKERVSAYLTRHLEYRHTAREAYETNPPAAAARLRKIKEQLAALPPEERDAALQRIMASEKLDRQEEAPVT